MYVFTAAIIFIALVSIDLFAGGLSYGTGRIRIPFGKAIIINIVGKILVAAALFTGYYVGNIIPDVVGIWVGFGVLLTLGLVKATLPLLRKDEKPKQPISFKEAIVLAVVMSFDGAAMAFGTTVADMPIYFIFVVLGTMLVTDQLVLMGSNTIGLYLSKHGKARTINFDWVAGLVLIIVAVAKLLIELYM